MMRWKAVLGFAALAASMTLGGCAHLVVLNDPLTPTEHNDLGVVYESNGERGHAAKEYRRALKLDSHLVRARVNLGNIEAANERWRKSEQHYRHALADSGSDGDAMNNLAIALLRQGRDLDEAHALAERAALTGGERAPIYLATLAEVQAGIQKKAPSITVVAAPPAAEGVSLAVPIVEQAPERCGQAALEMVLRYYGAAPGVPGAAEGAYDAALHGALITDLAAAARRAGYEATIATLTSESLIALVAAGVPPIVLYQNGHAPLTVTHFGVVTGWDSEHESFTVNDGGPKPRTLGRDDLEKRWRTAGSQALIVRRGQP